MAPQAERFPVPTALIAVASCCLISTTAAVGARAFIKARDWRSVQIDDVFILLAKLGFVAFVAIFFESAIAGQGTSISQLPSASIQRVRRSSNILSIVYAPTILAAKIAILIQIARFLSSIRRRTMTWMTWTLLVVSTIGYTAIFLLRILACTPRARLTNTNVSGKCISRQTDAIVAGIVGIISNVVILGLMSIISTKVQLTFPKKICVALILGLGGLACTCSILELVKGLSLAGSSDFSKVVFAVNLWALAETTSILIIACSPALPHFLGLFVRRISDPDNTSIQPKWFSTPSSRSTTPGSKEYASGRETPATARHSPVATPTPGPLRPTISAPIASITHIAPVAPRPPPRPFSIFEPAEQRISHLSHSTWHSAMSAPPSRGPSQSYEVPPSPISPTQTEYSVHECRAWEMSVVPIALGNITKTIQVRVSAHTNPGSPVVWGAPDPRW